MFPISILQYQTREGRSPFREWLLSLYDRDARARIRTRIDRLQLGNFGDCKAVGEGVLELRIFYGPGYRIYFGRQGREIVILLCGGSKASQSADIRRAREYWRDYRRRTGESS